MLKVKMYNKFELNRAKPVISEAFYNTNVQNTDIGKKTQQVLWTFHSLE